MFYVLILISDAFKIIFKKTNKPGFTIGFCVRLTNDIVLSISIANVSNHSLKNFK